MPVIDTRSDVMAVYRRQGLLPSIVDAILSGHLAQEEELRHRGLRPEIEQQHLSQLTAATTGRLVEAFDAVDAATAAHIARETAAITASTVEPTYALTPLDEQVLAIGDPEDLDALATRANDPTVAKVVVRRLETLARHQVNDMTSPAFRLLTKWRTPQSRPMNRAAKLVDLERGAHQRQTHVKAAILAAAQTVANISEQDLQRHRVHKAALASKE
jgi:hypothetical protein